MALKKSSNSHFSKASLASLSNDALCKLRDEIGALLEGRAQTLRKELGRLTGDSADAGDKKTAKVKRFKNTPKYRGPGGKTWGGRGARPRWLSNALENGRTLEDFLIAPAPERDSD